MNIAKLPIHPAQYLPYLTIAVLAVVCTLFIAPEAKSWLTLSTNGPVLSQWWTLITKHFLHTNNMHLIVNLVGLFLVWMLYGDYFLSQSSILRFTLLFFSLCILTSLFTLYFSTNDGNFIGLSGVLHGLFLWGVVQDIRMRMATGILLLAGLLFKLGQEQFFEDSAFMANIINADVAVDAHLYGAISGLLLGVLVPSQVNRHTP